MHWVDASHLHKKQPSNSPVITSADREEPAREVWAQGAQSLTSDELGGALLLRPALDMHCRMDKPVEKERATRALDVAVSAFDRLLATVPADVMSV